MKNHWKTALLSMALILFTSMIISCNKDDENLSRKKIYTLESVENSGVAGRVTFAEADNSLTTVTIELTGSAADTVHVAHIHEGAKRTGGAMAFPLADVVNSKSVTLVDKSYDEFMKFNGHINVHASKTNLEIVATTNIGSNE